MQKNRIEVAGYLAAKPAHRYLPSGTPVANVRIGESYAFKDADGKPQKHTNWHSLSFYDDLATAAMSLDQGDNIFVEGSVEQRQFTPKTDGIRRTVQEIIVRAFHIIAPSRGPNSIAIPDHPPVSEPDGAQEHDRWPVG
jgi:single-strand DNA-binding protein